MKLLRSLAAIAFAALALTGVAEAQQKGLADPLDAIKIFTDATAAGDIDALVGLYAPQALLLFPNAPPIIGRDAIRAVEQQNASLGANSIAISDPIIDKGDQQAVVYWTWTFQIKPAKGDAMVRHGRSLVYFVRTPDGWFISADMLQDGPAQ